MAPEGKTKNDVTVQAFCMCDLRRPAHVCKLRSADVTRVSSYSLHMFHDNPGKTWVSQSQTELETLFRKVNRLSREDGKESRTSLLLLPGMKGRKGRKRKGRAQAWFSTSLRGPKHTSARK